MKLAFFSNLFSFEVSTPQEAFRSVYIDQKGALSLKGSRLLTFLYHTSNGLKI